MYNTPGVLKTADFKNNAVRVGKGVLKSAFQPDFIPLTGNGMIAAATDNHILGAGLAYSRILNQGLIRMPGLRRRNRCLETLLCEWNRTHR